MMLQLDHGAKSIVKALKKQGMWDNTFLIFSSDVRILIILLDIFYKKQHLTRQVFYWNFHPPEVKIIHI